MTAFVSGEAAPHSASSPVSPERAARDFLEWVKTPCRLLVGYSGGGDSTGLLVALAEVLKADPDLDISLVAATVDHGLRAGSDDEACAAGALPASLCIPHHILTWEGEKPKTGVQAAAREARYRLLGELARTIGADLIVTAHNLDDQAETISMRQARNPEAAGGISEAVLYDRRIWVCRPFLEVDREAIRDYLRARGVGWVEDPSNDNDRFERVRVRRALARHESVLAEDPSPTPPHKGEGLTRPLRGTSIEAGRAPRVFSPLVGEMAGRPEGVFLPGSKRRGDEDEVIARFLLDNTVIHSARVAVVDLSHISQSPSAALDAIRHLAALMGGRTHLSGRETTGRIMDFLADPDQHRLTAERVVFDRRKHLLYITRERRSLPTVTVEPSATILWDSRFRIENLGAEPAVIGVRSTGQTGRALIGADLPAGLPGAVCQRVEATEPILLEGRSDRLIAKPIIAQFERFLPIRMLGVANALAFLDGLDHFPGLPAR
jgi:tRNA(Ile)-lysidine synthase